MKKTQEKMETYFLMDSKGVVMVLKATEREAKTAAVRGKATDPELFLVKQTKAGGVLVQLD